MLDSKKHNSSEKSGPKSLKNQKKEDSKRSMHHTDSSNRSRRARSRSPIPVRSSSVEEINSADVVNVQADESSFKPHHQCIILDEFNEEISTAPSGGKSSSDSKETERRRIVSTSSLKDKSGKKSSEETPVVRSVVKVINYKSDMLYFCVRTIAPTFLFHHVRFCRMLLPRRSHMAMRQAGVCF